MLPASTLLLSMLLSCFLQERAEVSLVVAADLPRVDEASTLPLAELDWTRPSGEEGLAVITIDAASILVDGSAVLALQDGRLPTDELKGVLIWPLHQRLRAHADATSNTLQAGESLNRELAIIADRGVSAQLLWSIIHTAESAEFGPLYLAVETQNTTTLRPPPVPSARRVDVESHGPTLSLSASPEATGLGAERGRLSEVIATALPAGELGCASYKPLKDEPWGDTASSLGALYALGAGSLVLVPPEGRWTERLTSEPSTATARTLTAADSLSVLPIHTPTVVPPRADESVLPPCALGAYEEDHPPPHRPLTSAPGGQVTRMALSVDGPMDLMLAEAALERSHPRLAYCYQRALPDAPTLSGDVQFTVTVAGAKTVSAMVGQSTVGNAQVERCIADQLKRVRFPTTKGDDFVKLNGTLALRPEEP